MKNIPYAITRSELLRIEEALCASLSLFFDFGDHAVYFPQAGECHAQWINTERKLLLPLIWHGENMGTLLLAGVRGRQVRPLLGILPELATFCLGLEILRLNQQKDDLTGLASEERLFSYLESELEAIRAQKAADGPRMQIGDDFHRLCLGMIILRWDDAEAAAKEFGPEFRREVQAAIVSELVRVLPSNVLAAPLGKYEGRNEIGLLVHADSTSSCMRQAVDFLNPLQGLMVRHPLIPRKYQPDLYAGFALFPQDIRGDESLLPIFEQVLRLRDRARLASVMASRGIGDGQADRILAFRDIARKGGRIMEYLSNGSARINLGLTANVSAGMRFDVFGTSETGHAMKKGQLIILSSEANESMGEILYLTTALRPVPGDIIRPASDGGDFMPAFHDSLRSAGDKRWLDYRNFFAQFARLGNTSFCLASVQAQLSGADEESSEKFAKFLLEAEALPDQPLLAALYGNGGMLMLHAGIERNEAAKFYQTLYELGRACGITLQTGIFSWPFLDYGKTEAEVCAQKALECAKLLPAPHVAFFDSIALTVNADKLYSAGHAYAAIKEYEAAVLADSENVTALNSLGVALASLGKLDEAKRHLARALRQCREAKIRAQICYNLGAIHQQEKDLAGARAFYRRAVESDSGYAWAWLRLGQICDLGGRRAEAARMYEKAIEAGTGNVGIVNAANRHLARLRARKSRQSEAREILHDILASHPEDVSSILELAQLYLENSEDPGMAEMLAARAVDLGAGKRGWLLLAEALEKQGREEEAARARRTIL